MKQERGQERLFWGDGGPRAERVSRTEATLLLKKNLGAGTLSSDSTLVTRTFPAGPWRDLA